jgi:hypothetical protein
VLGLAIGVGIYSRDPEDPVGGGMVSVETDFVTNVQENENATRQSYRQPRDVDHRVLPLLKEISPGRLEIDSQH